MVLTLPKILEDYYEEIEQDTFGIRNEQVLDDCDYIIGEIAIGEWYSGYTKAEKKHLKQFRTLLRNNMTTSILISGY